MGCITSSSRRIRPSVRTRRLGNLPDLRDVVMSDDAEAIACRTRSNASASPDVTVSRDSGASAHEIQRHNSWGW
jgi:hypothetical protein